MLSDGTPGGLRCLLRLFLDDAASTTAQLRAAIEAGDAGRIHLLAHGAGGTAAACGANRLSALLFALENGPRSGVRDRQLIESIAVELDAVGWYLGAHLEVPPIPPAPARYDRILEGDEP